MRVPDGERQALITPVPSSAFSCLVARPRGETIPALALLQHVGAVVALEIERRGAQQEARRRLGGELLAHLIDRRIDTESGSRRMGDFGLAEAELVLLAVDGRQDDSPDLLDRSLHRSGVPNLQLRRSHTIYVLLREDCVGRVEALLGEGLIAGFSGPISGAG